MCENNENEAANSFFQQVSKMESWRLTDRVDELIFRSKKMKAPLKRKKWEFVGGKAICFFS
jgi:hypothetical protein